MKRRRTLGGFRLSWWCQVVPLCTSSTGTLLRIGVCSNSTPRTRGFEANWSSEESLCTTFLWYANAIKHTELFQSTKPPHFSSVFFFSSFSERSDRVMHPRLCRVWISLCDSHGYKQSSITILEMWTIELLHSSWRLLRWLDEGNGTSTGEFRFVDG